MQEDGKLEATLGYEGRQKKKKHKRGEEGVIKREKWLTSQAFVDLYLAPPRFC
jgi:hypothetical protein